MIVGFECSIHFATIPFCKELILCLRASGATNTQKLKISAARPIDITDCEKVSRHLNYSLPVDNVNYERLEVSSPGLDRPVKTVADHIRFAGLEANVKLRVAHAGRKNYVGVLQGLISGDADSVDAKLGLLIKNQDGSEAMFEFTLAEVEKTRLVPVVVFLRRVCCRL